MTGTACGWWLVLMLASVAASLQAAAAAPGGAEAEGPSLPNGGFEEGTDVPTGWRLEGTGAWQTSDAGHFVSVTGSGEDTSYWRTGDLAFAPGALCRLRFRYSAEGASGGCVIAGPGFCNRDFPVGAGWQEESFVFVAPTAAQPAAEPDAAYLRLGQWNVTGQVSFDDVRMSVARPLHRQVGALVLGEGEQVAGAEYVFLAPLSAESANYARPLDSFTAAFNTNRWVFTEGSQVTYVHALPGARQLSAQVELNCCHHGEGTGVLEASADGRRWVELARFGGVGRVRGSVPAELLPAEAVRVRIRAAGPGYFQVDDYRYAARLDADLGHVAGSTAYPDVSAASPTLSVDIVSLATGGGEDVLRLALRNREDRPREVRVSAAVTAQGGRPAASALAVSLRPREEAVVDLPCALRNAGENVVEVEASEGGQLLYRASITHALTALDDASYGYALPSEGPTELWWCEGAYKVSRTRPAPAARASAVELAAARNEYEPVQVVIRPRTDLTGVRVSASDFTGPAAVLPAANVTIAQVDYVNITRPTDAAGAPGEWPDPLPPFEQGPTWRAGANHPLWVTVYVPPDQPAGTYEGVLAITADQWRGSVPLRLRVWDFALPKESHLRTAFGLWPDAIRTYHNLETTDELRQVLDLYFRDFAAHRIAPYDPAPLDPFQVRFGAGRWEGGEYDSGRPHDGKRCLKVTDASPTESVAAYGADLVGVDPRGTYRFSWWVRTERPGQPYLVTLSQYDDGGQWMSGNNIDIAPTGSGQWQKEEVTVGPGRLNPGARSVRVFLRPAPWSEAGEAAGTAWFDDLSLTRAEGGANLLAEVGFELEAYGLEAQIDFTAFDRECERYLDGLGFSTLMVTLRGMPSGTFHSHTRGRIGAFAQGSPEYQMLMASQGRQIAEHLRGKDWLRKAYVYWFDEPEPKDYEFVSEGMELLNRSAPGLTRMLTEEPEGALFGRVDLWCPVVSAVTPEAIRARREKGERFWWYLCTGPKAPYIGLFIDRPAVDLRVWAWLSRKWGVEGHLVWAANYWTSDAAYPPPDVQNPWQDPMSYVSGYSFGAGQVGFWGNGDGRFIYPPNRDVKSDRAKRLNGPVPSVRWEMLREGVEDYEYFCQLDQLIAQAERERKAGHLLDRARALALVPDSVIKDDRTYSKDPQPLYAHRRQVAEMIEALRQALAPGVQ